MEGRHFHIFSSGNQTDGFYSRHLVFAFLIHILQPLSMPAIRSPIRRAAFKTKSIASSFVLKPTVNDSSGIVTVRLAESVVGVIVAAYELVPPARPAITTATVRHGCAHDAPSRVSTVWSTQVGNTARAANDGVARWWVAKRGIRGLNQRSPHTSVASRATLTVWARTMPRECVRRARHESP